MTHEKENNMDNDNIKSDILLNGNDNGYVQNICNKDTTNPRHRENRKKIKRITRGYTCCTIYLLISGILTILLAFLTTYYSIFNIFMEERLRMTPGLPSFEWWRKPEPEVRMKVYIFTVTNPDEFLNKTDNKLKLKEFGPIIYKEILEHLDPVFHDNSTLSYTVHRYLEFIPEANEPGILNQTIIVPNIVLLGMAATLQDSLYFVKLGFNVISRKDQIFLNTTVYNVLWNFTTPALVSAEKVVPFMVPQDNGGALHNVYKNFKDRVNVRIGPKYGYEQFFLLNSFNGRPTVPGFKPERGDCFASIVNSTEGALYPNFLKKDHVLYYWRKTVCRAIPLIFENEVKKGSILAYKFIAETSMYDRFENTTIDCYKGFNKIHLESGLSDVSKCYNQMPVAVSVPHFCGSNGSWNDYLEGFKPSKENHTSYAIIEPMTGVPIDQCARSQSNLILPKLTGFSKEIQLFSGKVIPMSWIEYHQEKLTPAIDAMLIFTVNILPILQYILPMVLYMIGLSSVILGICRLKYQRQFNRDKAQMLNNLRYSNTQIPANDIKTRL